MRRAAEYLSTVVSLHLAREGEPAQEIGFSSRPYLLCSLPIRSIAATTYERRNGHYVLKMWTEQGQRLPFGQDRLLLLWLATKAIRQQNRIVSFDSAAEILDCFQLSKAGKEYRRVIAGFKRLYYATMSFEKDGPGLYARRYEFFKEVHIWCVQDAAQPTFPDLKNYVILGENFWEELKAHPIPVDFRVVRQLRDRPGNLDFYLWLTWRCWRARYPVTIAVASLREQFGVSETIEPRQFRRRVAQWLDMTRTLWPDCPARLEAGILHVSHSQAVKK